MIHGDQLILQDVSAPLVPARTIEICTDWSVVVDNKVQAFYTHNDALTSLSMMAMGAGVRTIEEITDEALIQYEKALALGADDTVPFVQGVHPEDAVRLSLGKIADSNRGLLGSNFFIFSRPTSEPLGMFSHRQRGYVAGLHIVRPLPEYGEVRKQYLRQYRHSRAAEQERRTFEEASSRRIG